MGSAAGRHLRPHERGGRISGGTCVPHRGPGGAKGSAKELSIAGNFNPSSRVPAEPPQDPASAMQHMAGSWELPHSSLSESQVECDVPWWCFGDLSSPCSSPWDDKASAWTAGTPARAIAINIARKERITKSEPRKSRWKLCSIIQQL